jgi:putative heme transporter
MSSGDGAGLPCSAAESGAGVPGPLRVAAAYSWRLLLVGAAVVVAGLLVARLWLVVLAVLLALFGTALLRPPTEALKARGWPPAVAAGGVLAGAVGLLGGLMLLIVPPFVAQLEDLGASLRGGIDSVRDWLIEGPLELSRSDLDDYVAGAAEELRQNTDVIIDNLLSGAQLAGSLLAAAAIALVVTFFFLKDGDQMVDWFVGLFDRRHERDLRELGARSWDTLAGYLRGMTLVALFDAVLIGLALAVIGVPAALPLAVFTFFGAYVPIVGAVVTGLAAVLVALVALGLVDALIVLAAVVIVQQTESNLLHPVVVSRAVSVHPVVILLAVTTGAVLAGVPGAVVAVPVAAVAARIGGFVREKRRERADAAPRDAAPAPPA